MLENAGKGMVGKGMSKRGLNKRGMNKREQLATMSSNEQQ